MPSKLKQLPRPASCKVCLRAFRRCEWKTPPPKVKRILLPQNSDRLHQARPSEQLRFIDRREIQYFRAYQETAATELSGFFKSSAWSYTLLQSCYQEPFVLRAVVAIGALNMAAKSSYGRPGALQVAQQHRDFALASYDRAIVGMKQTKSLRNTLLACLLVHCMEVFLNSPITAFRQSQNGYQLLQNWTKGKTLRSDGLASPDSSVVEDEIINEFKRLDLEHAVRWGEKDISRHSARRQEGTITIKNMPTRFGHLDEARLYNELILRRAAHLVGEAYARIMEANTALRHLFTSGNPGELVDSCFLPKMLFQAQNAHLNDMKRWSEAYNTLFRKLGSSHDSLTVCGAALLRVHILSSEISLRAAFIVHECDFDRFTPLFSEIVSLSLQIEARSRYIVPKDQPIFMFAHHTDRPLFDVAMYCRDYTLRHQAIQLLTRIAHQDPTKVTARLVTRASFLAELEEQGRLTDGSIPESARWRNIWTLHHYNEELRRLTLLLCRRTGYPLGTRYPAQREWKRRTFTQEEAEGMFSSPWREEMHWQPWPPKEILNKPMCIAWGEVLDELQTVTTGATRKTRIF